MAKKKLKKISKELLKASAMHKGQAERIKKMLKHGGYKSRYQAGGLAGVPTNLSDTTSAPPILNRLPPAINTPESILKAKLDAKRNRANFQQQQHLLKTNKMQEQLYSAAPRGEDSRSFNQFKKTIKPVSTDPMQAPPRTYQVGGMYGDNTVAAAGQGNMGSTSNIVYQESDPRLQEERVRGLEEEQKMLEQDIAASTAEAKQIKEEEELAIQEAAAESEQKAQRTSAIIQTGIEGGKAVGLLKKGKTAGQSVKDAVKAFKTVRAANKARKGFEASRTAFNLATQGTKGIDTGLTLAKSTANVAKLGQQGLQTGKTLQQGFQLGKTATGIGGTATQFGGSAANLTGSAASGASAAGSAASALNNANVYAAAANLAGKGIKRLADDDDATTWTAGEASGDVLSKAGEYAGYGAILGSAVPVIGNAVGAVGGAIIGTGVGLFQGFKKRGAARQAEREQQQKQLAFKTETDTETKKRLGTQMARVRSGQLKQKTYSGYDLGRNVTNQMGGLRMGIPRYGYAA